MLNSIVKLSFSPRRSAWLFGLILAAITILAYQPAWNGGFVWDDDEYVVKNRLLTAPDGLRRIWFSLDSPSQYFPLTYTTFRIERALWDLSPAGYHWVNLLLHVANALLVWWLLVRLKIPGAWLAAGIFALHPVQVESVAWITERKNVLMGFFFLLTLLAWTEFIDERNKRPWNFYALALIFYLLALFSKSTACTLPVALFLILWLQTKRIDWRRVVQIVPFLLLGLAMGLVAIWWERFHQGTRGALFVLGPLERLIIASHAVWFYLGKLFWPAKLTFIYPQWTIHAKDLLSYGWLLSGIALCALIFFVRKHVGRSIEVAAAFFVTTLSPVLGFIMLYTFRYTFVADHYQYLASIGPIALASAALAKSTMSIQPRGRFVSAVAISILGILAILTYRQARSYSDIETLWRTTIAKNPGCWMAENNLGIALVGTGRIDEAIAHYQKSLQLHSDYPQTHYNLANAFVQKGEVNEAIAEARIAIDLYPNDPDAYVVLGTALLANGLVNEAIADYSKSIELQPAHSSAHYNLAIALAQKHDAAAAVTHYEKAIEAQPDFFEALTNLARILAASPDPSVRNGNKAVELAEKAKRLTSGTSPPVLRTLAAAYAENGRFDKAVETGRQSLWLAQRQRDFTLAEAINHELSYYELNMPYRDP